MRKLDIGPISLRQSDVFVIAEIGSNHNGDVKLCEEMIRVAADCGVDAVKMQKRDNKELFTKTAYSRPYDNDLSYAPTYGEHREHLDWFGWREFKRFQGIANEKGVLFFATPFEIESLKFLHKLKVPMYKIASCDVSNLPLIEAVARKQKPVIVSTGGCTRTDLLLLKSTIEPINQNFAILHCVSTYPNLDHHLNLSLIQELANIFPNQLIGFSSHHPGLLPNYLARFLGASIFEVHFTLNRGFRGTDHGFSLEPAGLAKLCKDLKRIEPMMGKKEKRILAEEMGGFVDKMGKGLYLRQAKKRGQFIDKSEVIIKAPAQGGLKPWELDGIDGAILVNDVSTGQALREADIHE
jgi:N-acetylneuraminate synthase/sialic acid synthase